VSVHEKRNERHENEWQDERRVEKLVLPIQVGVREDVIELEDDAGAQAEVAVRAEYNLKVRFEPPQVRL